MTIYRYYIHNKMIESFFVWKTEKTNDIIKLGEIQHQRRLGG